MIQINCSNRHGDECKVARIVSKLLNGRRRHRYVVISGLMGPDELDAMAETIAKQSLIPDTYAYDGIIEVTAEPAYI